MDIFLSNVDHFSTQHDVVRTLASVFHTPKYSASMPLNFHVRLFKGQGGRKHSGCGLLTLPWEDIGEMFLSDPAAQCVYIGGRLIKFKRHNKPAPNGIVERVRTLPYRDPVIVEKQERKAEVLETSHVPIQMIQWGWYCRDHVYSVEWEYLCTPEARLYFVDDDLHRQIHVFQSSFVSTNEPLRHFLDIFSATGHDLGQPPRLFDIVVDYSRILYIGVDDHVEPSIFFEFAFPPLFLSDVVARSLIGSGSMKGSRVSSLPVNGVDGRPHAEIAPFTSLYLRLVCPSPASLETFRLLSREANFSSALTNNPMPTVYNRCLFSRLNLERLFGWINSLPFHVAYQVESLIYSYSVDPREILDIRSHIDQLLLDMRGMDRGDYYFAEVMREFGLRARQLFWGTDRETSLSQCFTNVKQICLRRLDKAPSRPSWDGNLDAAEARLFSCHHVFVTPTSIILEGPYLERSNRVIRSYRSEHRSNFLRVSFVDEGKFRLESGRSFDLASFLKIRINAILKQTGLKIAGRLFRFLAYSQSALKEHATWFLSSFEEDGVVVDVPGIISNLGHFDDKLVAIGPGKKEKLIRCPALYAARISQGFTTSDPTDTTIQNIRFDLEDIERRDPAGVVWTFTDGVGTMSPELAQRTFAERQSKRRGRRRPPQDYYRALQIRFMGSKGVVSVDYRLPGLCLCLRPSMTKFSGSTSSKIEIVKVFDKPGKLYLNRPLIMLLEGLGVPTRTFMRYLEVAVKDAHASKNSLALSSHFWETHGLGQSWSIAASKMHLANLGATIPESKFYREMDNYAINDVLRLMKYKARIPIPGAYNLVGIADVHEFLEPGQIFCCVKSFSEGSQDNAQVKYLRGPVLITRSPVIHPGGGDLDGDEYNIIPLLQFPDFRFGNSYSPIHDSDGFKSNNVFWQVLGIVSTQWLLLADQLWKRDIPGIFSEECLVLANLHSQAVDYPKSGSPVDIRKIRMADKTMLPDWYAPETMTHLNENKYYKSPRALGHLFRAIKLQDAAAVRYTADEEQQRFYQDYRDSFLDEVQMDLMYDFARRVTHTDDPNSVPAVVERVVAQTLSASADEEQAETSDISSFDAHGGRSGGTIVANTSHPRKRQEHVAKLREQTELLARNAREHILGDRDASLESGLSRAYYAWILSLYYAEKDVFGAESFGWMALATIFSTIRDIEYTRDEEQAEQLRCKVEEASFLSGLRYWSWHPRIS
ncbi:RdRP-domain-containing protein [Fistulina hepatica ATCC 64428]|uniref:RNA-dependent RNA polymerase n=1 Tax=Fistulina hepatica ATCC 64428 TaxID=1128425 RepID=A0A0D7A730_9AGAR|nr:RdRP-domain-containing protein [Fistulina hepatica ATCC 64428]